MARTVTRGFDVDRDAVRSARLDELAAEEELEHLRVAIMGRSLRGQFSGVVRYTHELIRALAPHFEEPPLVYLTQADDGLGGAPVQTVRAPMRTPNEYARAFWEQTIVPLDVRRRRPDVYHSPNFILPFAVRCPSVVTVHDLAFLDRSVHRLRSHLYLSALATYAIHRATRIICVSEYTARQLGARFPGVSDRVRVIGEGVHPRFRPQAEAAIERFRRRFGLVDPYVLFVGTIEPRKNLARLIEAFSAAVRGHAFPHRLVIAGAPGWMNGPVREAYDNSPVRDRIYFTGYLPEHQLSAAYAGADIFAYPSLHEGYGLPPIEAMACGTAVLTSNVTSIPEVVGDAALLVDPHDVTAIADGLTLLMRDAGYRSELAAAGRVRARDFSWGDAARKTIEVYREAASP
jgi:glycosyltransferase involved in cell wall biosynthesis